MVARRHAGRGRNPGSGSPRYAHRYPHRPGSRLPDREPDRGRRAGPCRETARVRLAGSPLSIGILGGVASVVVRFRRSRGVERQQMKWFLFAAAPIVTFPVTEYLPGIVSNLIFFWLLISLPAAIGIAVLRYRLYDIDVVINRTLVYGPLTASLVLVYVGSVVSLQYLFRLLTGESSQLVIVASTLAIAALFNPLRRRIQRFIDHRFYRRKYDARRTLEDFSARLREETDLDRLGEDLMGVVKETMQPSHISLWLHPDPALKDKKKRADIREAGH